MYRISGRPDNPAPDRRFFKNPVPAGFHTEIRPAAGFLRIPVEVKQFPEDVKPVINIQINIHQSKS